MDQQRINYGPFGFPWGYGLIGLLAGGMAVGMIYLFGDIRLGSALRCVRGAGARKGPPGKDGRFIRCTSRNGSRRHSFTLEGVRGARIGKRHKSDSYEVYLTYADGSTQRVLPTGRVVQHRFGPTDKATAQAAVRSIEMFLQDPSQRRLGLTLPAASTSMLVMFVGSVLFGLLALYALLLSLRSLTRFTIERDTVPSTLMVQRTLLGVALGTRTLRVTGATRVVVDRRGLDRILAALGIGSTLGARIGFYDDATDVLLAYLTRAYYPGAKQHEDTADALRSLLSLPR